MSKVTILKNESGDEVVADFRATGLYEEEFLQDLGQGLNKSSLGAQKNTQGPASCR